MTPDEVLTLAQAGNPKVLAAIMNRSTQPYGITVKVACKDGCLHVLLEGEAIANSTSLITFVEGSLNKLKVTPDYAVKVYGRQSGDQSIAWSHAIRMPSEPSTPEPQLVVTPSTDSPVTNNTPAFPNPQPGESTDLDMALSPPVQDASDQSVPAVGEGEPEGIPTIFDRTVPSADEGDPDRQPTPLHEAPTGASDEITPMSEDMPEEVPEKALEEAPEETSQELSDLPHNEAAGESDEMPPVSEEIPEEASEGVPEEMPEEMPEETTQELSEAVSPEVPAFSESPDIAAPLDTAPENPDGGEEPAIESDIATPLDTAIEEPDSGEPDGEMADVQTAESPDSLQVSETSAHDRVMPSQEDTGADPLADPWVESPPGEDAILASEPLVRADDDIQESAKDVRTETQVTDSSDSSMDIPTPPQPEPATEGSELPDETIDFDEASDDPEAFNFQAMLKRPEALVIVLFAIALYIWQLYAALIQKAAPDGSVTGQQLANRLGVSKSTISRRKLDPDFAAWSASLDPEGIAWVYTSGAFGPQMPDFGDN